MMRSIASTLALCAVALVVRAQSPQVPTSARQTVTISGRVVADETGDPRPNARVSITSATLGTRVVLADGDGYFALSVPPDRYTVVAAKTGYVKGETTATGGQAIEIRLRRAAAISGSVVNEFGDPVQTARVVAETMSDPSSNAVTVASAQTDDRGEYRLASLPSGTFVVAVTTFPAMAIMRGPDQVGSIVRPSRKSYYPGMATANEAETLRLRFGEERPGVDFVIPGDQISAAPVVFVTKDPSARGTEQNPIPGASGIIRGRVVTPDGRAVPHANVILLGQDDMQSRVDKSDLDGRYEFARLAAGTFRIFTQKEGYKGIQAVEGVGGVPAIGSSRSIQLRNGETHEPIDLALTRGGTLAGRVVDELGDPVQGASTQVLQVRYEGGRRRLEAVGVRVTDDLGRYRLYGLTPGQYIVSATVGAVSPADLPGYARAYFPGTANPAEAQFVAIGSSQEIGGIDFTLSRTRTVRVAGRSLNAAGEPATADVWLVPIQRSNSVAGMRIGARLSNDGTFEFPDVPPGQYLLQAYRGRINSWTQGEFGAIPLSVSGSDVTDLIFQTSSGSSIRGRLTFNSFNNSKTPASSDIELSPMPVDIDAAPYDRVAANIHPDWSFEIEGVNGAHRLHLARASAGWALQEIRVNGIDLDDRPLSFGRRNQSLTDVEVVLTDRINELSGTIADGRGGPASGSHAIVFSTDRGRWYPASRFLRKGTAGPDGTFMLAGLPFGSYYAAAVARLPVEGEDAWQDSEFLGSLVTRASTVTLGDGQKTSVSLRLPR